MVSKKEDIDLSSLEDESFQEDFAKIFCNTFIPQLRLFAADYRKGIENNDTDLLFAIVHKMTSSLMFIKLVDFCDLINQYKIVDTNNHGAKEELVQNVESYSLFLEQRLLEFKPN